MVLKEWTMQGDFAGKDIMNYIRIFLNRDKDSIDAFAAFECATEVLHHYIYR